MLQDALTPQAEAAPWMVLVPGLAIVITVLAFSVIADGIRVALDTSIGQETGDELDVEPAPYAAAPATAT
jgi:ABC-type dipeptide/oligopeptide/nickel transport system permease subunit